MSRTRLGVPGRWVSTGFGVTGGARSVRFSPVSWRTCSGVRSAVWTVAALTAASGMVAAVGKVLGHPKRLEILDLLAREPEASRTLPPLRTWG